MITVICPFLNEIRMVKAWLANVRKFADEIITMNTGSIDGTDEYLISEGITIIGWTKLGYEQWNVNYNEYVARQHLRDKASGDWIVNLDMDELVGDDFIDFVKSLPDSMKGRKIARMKEMKFWGDIKTLRMPSLWPPVSRLPGRNPWSTKGWRLLRNYRGATGGRIVRLFKNDPAVNYGNTWEHPLIQDGRGRLTYRDFRITLNPPVDFHHFHFALPPKPHENRTEQRGQEFKTKPYQGPWPIETSLIDFSFKS
jgi:glycosyltransferase involved in cell wall biosynthesis